jgi:hypothetical protein
MYRTIERQSPPARICENLKAGFNINDRKQVMGVRLTHALFTGNR